MQHSSRYLVGIDFGTTNSVVAYIDTHEAGDRGEIRTLAVPQLVAPGEIGHEPALPSFLYFPTEQEVDSGVVQLPWDTRPQSIAGVMARDHGALSPTRQVMSTKSWLANGAADRRASILPRDAEPGLISPVEASARYLRHLREAWNLGFAADPEAALEKQDIYLTVPASFDEEARELTVEAAHLAGLNNIVLLEEPLAAFYSWISAHRESLHNELSDGDLVLICDIGGGTSDFSLIRARIGGDQVQFEREAIGEHLLLGGDNLDLALTHVVQAKLGATRLTMRQRHALQRACARAKERLLSEPGLDRAPITILGSGRQVVGQLVTSELLRGEVTALLMDGFLPMTSLSDQPRRGSSLGLREIGLPYVNDPAVTKHLASFLRQAGSRIQRGDGAPARPDAILFNGGFCDPEIVQQRIGDAIANWFSRPGEQWRPRILRSVSLAGAVATGAAHYGRVRRGEGLRVQAGSARTYYIGLRSEQGLQGVCVLPSGTQEGTNLLLENRRFGVRANRPVSFTLYSSRLRHDPHGAVATLDPEQVEYHAPLVTLLRYGKKMRDVELSVRLNVSFTEVGTMEIWCESTDSPHRWRLQFELRGVETQQAVEPARRPPATASAQQRPAIRDEALGQAELLIQEAFAQTSEKDAAEALTGKLEATLGAKRDAWPMQVIRHLADALLASAEGRKRSPRHEVRWLNLLGFCMRPGFGAPDDNSRMTQLRKLVSAGPVFVNETPCMVEFLVMLRRVCGGLNAAAQHELHRKYVQLLRASAAKRSARLNPQIEYDTWRLLASLEHLPVNVRTSLAGNVFEKVEAGDRRWFWPLARLGARIPVHGPLTCVLPPETIAPWLSSLVESDEISPEAAFAIVQLARRTGDPSRDMPDDLRKEIIRKLKDSGVVPELIRPIEKIVPPDRDDAVRAFGDSLPRDLPLIASNVCLLSITALATNNAEIAS